MLHRMLPHPESAPSSILCFVYTDGQLISRVYIKGHAQSGHAKKGRLRTFSNIKLNRWVTKALPPSTRGSDDRSKKCTWLLQFSSGLLNVPWCGPKWHMSPPILSVSRIKMSLKSRDIIIINLMCYQLISDWWWLWPFSGISRKRVLRSGFPFPSSGGVLGWYSLPKVTQAGSAHRGHRGESYLTHQAT